MPNEPVVEALATVWESIVELGADLSEEQWATPTSLPGWTVKDNVSHMIGTERLLAGYPPEECDATTPDYVKNGIGEINEPSVALRRPLSGAEVLEEFRAITAARIEALRSMSDDDMAADSWTPVGPWTYRMFMEVRVFDCWFHEQDIREALDLPGHLIGPAAEYAYERTVASFPYVVGKRAGVPTGSTVTLQLTGDWERTVHVDVADKAVAVADLDRPATVTLTCDAFAFGRLTGGRWDKSGEQAVGAVIIDGDVELGRAIVDALDVVM
ncbi:MAG: maleylpyruvate isomerase family mycothiol-dependent enzyme [Acidimicrobiia bacterium]|nr:maleylpyruvate isomerase family mycothiol-dependent enzyme [Acidimicrobiia bacterium]